MSAASELVYALAEIRNGRLHIRNRRTFDEQIAQLPDRWELEISVKRLRATRSHLQNWYYFGVVIAMLVEDTGFSVDEMHDLMKAKFLPKRLAICDGNGVISEEYVLGGSTRELTTIEFGEYVEDIRRWAAEVRGLVIPDPTQEMEPRSQSGSKAVWYRAKRREVSDVA